MYLLDTNVVSELRRARPHGAVIASLRSVQPDEIFLSAVTIGEIQSGIEITRAQDATKAAQLEAWLLQVVASSQILPMDTQIFRICARMMHRQPDHLIEDAMIAATAEFHTLTVATRNVNDFVRFGSKTINPFVS